LAVRDDQSPSADVLPAWMTPELIRSTIETWQPYHADRLTEADAVGILRSVGRLVDVLEDLP